MISYTFAVKKFKGFDSIIQNIIFESDDIIIGKIPRIETTYFVVIKHILPNRVVKKIKSTIYYKQYIHKNHYPLFICITDNKMWEEYIKHNDGKYSFGEISMKNYKTRIKILAKYFKKRNAWLKKDIVYNKENL